MTEAECRAILVAQLRELIRLRTLAGDRDMAYLVEARSVLAMAEAFVAP